jgi:hypothetical protein
MDWIKRNLYFLIGSLVALALMGLAGFYLYSKWQLNSEMLGKLDEQYAELKRLNEQNPHPGSDQVNNIQAAKEQEKELRGFLEKARQFFHLCPPIPVSESGKLTSQEYSSALSRTLDQLQREATKASVTLPPKDSTGQPYCFSFAAQSKSLAYAPASLVPLSMQLAEVKAICSVLFQAKVNSLDSIRRERVSEDDSKVGAPPSDYLMEKSVTNELAVLSPYEVTFHCFSPELAAVLAGFATSPCGLLIKTINVESAGAATTATEAGETPAFTATPYAPPVPTPAMPFPSADQRMAERYGARGRGPGSPFGDRYGGRSSPYGDRYGARGLPSPVAPPTYIPPVAPAGPAGRGGLPIALDEKQLKVTLVLNAVKLIAPNAPNAPK